MTTKAETDGATPFQQGARFLRRRDSRLRVLIRQYGPCPLKPSRAYFLFLCKSIISQQISTKAAASIMRRFRELFVRRRPTPAALLKLTDGQLRGAGLSGQKLRYLRDLAARMTDGTVPTRKLSRMDDQQVIETLTQIKGVGVWTAEMFLIFALHRPDVWPVDDLGIRKAVQQLDGFGALPAPADIRDFADAWRPYRSVACWYLWRSLDNAPMGG